MAGRLALLGLLGAASATSAAAATLDASACLARTSGAAVGADAEAALAAWVAMDSVAFLAGSDRVRGELPCVDDVVAPTVAARVFRVEGLRAFGERDLNAAQAWFAAARAAAPEDAFPLGLVGETHPLTQVARALDVDQGRHETVAHSTSATLYFDGKPDLERALDWPSIVQVVDRDGIVSSTAMLSPTQPLPDLPPVASLPPAPLSSSSAGHSGRRARVLFAATAGGAAIASGVLYAMADASADAYWSEGTATPALDGLRTQTNRRAIAAMASGGLAVAAGAGLVVSVAW